MVKKYITMFYVKYISTLKSKKGQALTEYGIIIALIAVAVIGIIALIGSRLNEAFQKILDALTPPGTGTGTGS